MANNVASTEPKIVFQTPPISRITLGKSPFSNRKLSIPSTLNPNLLGLPHNGNGRELTKRRFSTVGDVVTRKLSSTIGWRNSTATVQDVVSQGRVLCGQYIKQRLKRSGIFNKKSYLSQLRSAIGTSNNTVTEVTPFLTAAGVELERMYPKLFTSISRQATVAPGGVLESDTAAPGLLVAISQEVLKNDITWGKVVAIFAISGGLAVDCVYQGHPEYLHGIMEGMSEVLEDALAEWVATNGGWSALCGQCTYPKKDMGVDTYLTTLSIVFVLFIFICLGLCWMMRI